MQLDGNGLVLDTVVEILDDLQTRVRDALGEEIETGPETALGQILSIVANALRLLQEAVAAAYNANYRGSATGVNLVRVGSLTGSLPLPATPSRVSVDVTLSGAVNLAIGALQIHVSGQPDRLFVNENVIVEAGAGTFFHIFVSLETGPVEAPAGTLTVIPVPIANVVSVNNPADADLGRDDETDTAYRARQEQELARPASATVDGIRVDVLDNVLDANGTRLIEDCRVFENTTDVMSIEGLPPHSIEVEIWDGSPPAAADTDVGQAVWDAKPGGIQAYGTISTTAVDSRGDSRSVSFTRPAVRRLVVEVQITAGPEYSTGADSTESRIQAALAAYWDEQQRIGQDLIRAQLYEPFWAAVENNDEVVDIVAFLASGTLNSPPDPADPPAATNVAIGVREIGVLAVSDVTITPV